MRSFHILIPVLVIVLRRSDQMFFLKQLEFPNVIICELQIETLVIFEHAKQDLPKFR